MKLIFKATSSLLAAVRTDLRRPHAFAAERIGFITAGFAMAGEDVLILARSYLPVTDDDYLQDDRVGAMIGPVAIRKAMQVALSFRVGIFHTHSHGDTGLPHFSFTDLVEQAKFMPSFIHVAPQCLHGALLLSDDAARGLAWLSGGGTQSFIEEFVEVGASLRRRIGR